jgi:quercetin dioxygenase-like cupin family protein
MGHFEIHSNVEKKTMPKKVIRIAIALTLLSMVRMDGADKEMVNNEISPVVVAQFFEKAKKNNNWKEAFVTGKHEQIVFMNVSPLTNPDNEIGMEEHPFDQVILIVEGKAKAILGTETSIVKEGDMIFIPQGISHNIINLDGAKGLKLISFYSEIDIPRGAVYGKKTDAP